MEQTESCQLSLPYDFDMTRLKPVGANDPRLEGGYLSQGDTAMICDHPVAQACLDEFSCYEQLVEDGSLSAEALAGRMKAIAERAKAEGLRGEAGDFFEKEYLEVAALKTDACCASGSVIEKKMTMRQAFENPWRDQKALPFVQEKAHDGLASSSCKETATGWWNKLFPDVAMDWDQEVTVSFCNGSMVMLPPRSETYEEGLARYLRVPHSFLMPAAAAIDSKLATQLHELGHAGGQVELSASATSLQAECLSYFAEFHSDRIAKNKGDQDRSMFRYLCSQTSIDTSYWLGAVHEAVRDGKQTPIFTDIRRAGMEIFSHYYYALSDHTGPVRENDLNFQSTKQILQWNSQNYLKAEPFWPESFYVLDCLQQGGVFDNSEKPLASHMARQMVKAAELVYGRNCIEAAGKHFLGRQSVEKQRQIYALKQNWVGASTL